MKNVEDDALPSINEYYDSVIASKDAMIDFKERYKDDYLEVIRFYQYALRRAHGFSSNFKDKKNESVIYEAALNKLRETEAVQKYLKQEITPEDVEEFERQKRKEVDEILAILAKRKKQKYQKSKNEDYDMDDFFDELVLGNGVEWYISKYSEIEIIQFYNYLLGKTSELSIDYNRAHNNVALCWLASKELEEMEAVKKFHNMEITQAEVDEYNRQIEEEIRESGRIVAQKQKNKKSLVKQFVRMFRK